MCFLLKAVRSLAISKNYGQKNYEIFVDRFNHVYSFSILFLLIIFISFVEFFRNPISCYVKRDLKELESYANYMCWNSSLNVPLNVDLTVNENERTNRLLYWFNWTPVILIFQAVFFYLPRFIWRSYCYKSDLNIESIEKAVNKYNSEDKIILKNSDELQTNVTNTFVTYIDSRKRLLLDDYLLRLFVLVKIAYMINSFAQLFILNRFLRSNDSLMFGSELFNMIGHGYKLFELELFPRLTKCHLVDADFGIDGTFQCTLSINRYNDLIFISLWFWLFLVSIFNLIDVISWVNTLILNRQDSYSYMKNRLGESLIRITDENDENQLRNFVTAYLPEDVVFMLRLMSLRNSHYDYKDLVVHRIVANLFNIYTAKPDSTNQTQLTLH